MVSNADYYSSVNSGWDGFLGEIADKVDGLVIESSVMEEFRKQIRLFAERWEEHRSGSVEYERKRREHWQKVKQNPTWQDKEAGPPKKGWEWHKCYLSNLPMETGPMHEMPAKYGPDLIAKIREYLERNYDATQKMASSTLSECQKLQGPIAEEEMNVKEIQDQLDELNPKQRNKVWIRTPPLLDKRPPKRTYHHVKWWQYFDLNEEAVFGCWRPPIEETPNNPLKYLIPEERDAGLPQAKNREEEYERYYVVLSSIHDNVLTGCERIDNGIWPNELADRVWNLLDIHFGDKRAFLNVAFNRVERDVKGKGLLDGGDEMPSHYVTCVKISGIIRKRSDAIARALKAAKYPVVKKAGNNYCDPEHAAVLYPEWKKHLKRQQENQ